MNRLPLRVALVLLILPGVLRAQISTGNADLHTAVFGDDTGFSAMGGTGGGGQAEASATRGAAFTRLAVGGTVSLLGTGAQMGTNLGQRVDARLFGNYLNLNHSFTKSGFRIALNIEMPNTGAKLDFYPLRRLPLRISPGYLYLNQNRVRADVRAQPGATFTINNVEWTSDNANPVYGTGRLLLGGSGFTVTTGLGHIVSHTRKRFTYPFEAGIVLINTPRASFNLFGQICTPQHTMCQPAATFPTFASNLAAQVADWNKTVAPFHIYPIVEGGVAYSFNFLRRPE